MATTNLGRVKPIHRGVYDPDFPYTPLDIVRYQGASYFCIKASQGNVPQDGEFFMAIVDGDLRYAQTAGGDDANFTVAPQIDGQSLDDRYQSQVAGKGLSSNDYTDNEKSKLEGIESEATKNATDTHLLNRENHTGTQTLETIRDAGTAAAANTEDFDPAGSAANAVEAHEQKLNPHPQYARLAEPNDFSYMPTVQGAPIVESGSNSDGDWVRWADGTQQCNRSVIGDNATRNYPQSFVSSPTIVVSDLRGVEQVAAISVVARSSTSFTTKGVFTADDGASWSSTGQAGAYIATGQWK